MSCKFDYHQIGDLFLPIIPISIKGSFGWTEIWGFVDSGATYSILLPQEADRLGLHFLDGQEIPITIGDGEKIKVYLHRLSIKIDEEEIDALIGFSDELGVNMNLWGRNGIFDNYRICFSNNKKAVIVEREQYL